MDKSRHGHSLLIKIVTAVCIVIGIITIVSLQLKNNAMKAETERLRQQQEINMQKIAELKKTIQAPYDREYIISVARDELGLCMPGEIIFYNNLYR